MVSWPFRYNGIPMLVLWHLHIERIIWWLGDQWHQATSCHYDILTTINCQWCKSSQSSERKHLALTHWGRVTHICVSELTIIASDNGLSPDRRQVIIWTSAGILIIGPLGTNFSEILIKIITFSFKKMLFKVSSAKWRPCCLGLNVITHE